MKKNIKIISIITILILIVCYNITCLAVEQPVEESLLEKKIEKNIPEQAQSYHIATKTSPDEIIDEGKDFLDRGKNNQGSIIISGDNVQNASDMIYNLLFAIGIGAAALIGIYLGIKMMISSAEDKAAVKEALLPYFVGVIVMFASFSIWKLILVLLQAVENV